MTSPTGPDRDRLRASDAGQETCGEPTGGSEEGYCPCVRVNCDGSHRCVHDTRPASQQPPAQEREVPCDMPEVCETPGRHTHPMQPSEADSADESNAALARLRTYLSSEDGGRAARIVAMLKDLPASVGRHGQVEHVARFLNQESALAASSGVRGGDDQARERLADVLELHQSLAGQDVWCVHDGQHWPCATVQAAGGAR